jgi:hypothetical protein
MWPHVHFFCLRLHKRFFWMGFKAYHQLSITIDLPQATWIAKSTIASLWQVFIGQPL